MAKRIRNFVDRSFARTVDLQLLHRLLESYLGQIDFEWDGLPEDDGKRREAIFGLFAKADLRFPAKLQFALCNIFTLSTDAGARIIQEIASEAGVDVLSAYRIESAPDDLRFTPRFMALVTWLASTGYAPRQGADERDRGTEARIHRDKAQGWLPPHPRYVRDRVHGLDPFSGTGRFREVFGRSQRDR